MLHFKLDVRVLITFILSVGTGCPVNSKRAYRLLSERMVRAKNTHAPISRNAIHSLKIPPVQWNICWPSGVNSTEEHGSPGT